MQLLQRRNPYRGEVLAWYRKFLKASFAVPWETDEDALYVLEEARRLFRKNAGITDVETIERKLREAEMRYEIGLHYRIPYPRAFHKTQGSLQESGVAYAADLDSMYDHPVNPRVGQIMEGSVNCGTMGGTEHLTQYLEEGPGVDDESLSERR
ncbi:LYR motif containing protein 1 [Trypanosoma conorhini]|uniref:LYR motif containing protein 1 n=1 Tax=Trypanosoma conorhini TaxID=83891 RepID=A0A422PFF5_9TRYP|nr:LYR motif containing protein 1 [Trypanosoma conorhini]RNF16423.1 LYR motif containing protein 1 [Trypanosoma conorhini]